MKKIIFLALIVSLLSSCSLFQIHKVEVIQGNIITDQEVSQLHRGMSTTQVKEIMGTPMLINLFAPNRIDYIYTYQQAHEPRQDHRLTCLFRNGRLVEIIRST
jgi:outer membrane protein assembly factor BamE